MLRCHCTAVKLRLDLKLLYCASLDSAIWSWSLSPSSTQPFVTATSMMSHQWAPSSVTAHSLKLSSSTQVSKCLFWPEYRLMSLVREDSNILLCDWLFYYCHVVTFLYSLARHWWIQVDRWHRGGQQYIHTQQDRMSDDVWWWLQCLLGVLHQLPGDPGCSARQHCVCPAHGQNWASVHVR